ncbi:MAG: hypothetical protein WCG06_04635, partial [Candidatus Omnitrophota bacterium]
MEWLVGHVIGRLRIDRLIENHRTRARETLRQQWEEASRGPTQDYALFDPARRVEVRYDLLPDILMPDLGVPPANAVVGAPFQVGASLSEIAQSTAPVIVIDHSLDYFAGQRAPQREEMVENVGVAQPPLMREPSLPQDRSPDAIAHDLRARVGELSAALESLRLGPQSQLIRQRTSQVSALLIEAQTQLQHLEARLAFPTLPAAPTAPVITQGQPQAPPTSGARLSERGRWLAHLVLAIAILFTALRSTLADDIQFVVDQAARQVRVLTNGAETPKSQLTAVVYQPAGRRHISYYNNGRMSELFVQLLPADDPVRKGLGLPDRGADDGQRLVDMGIYNIREYYLPLENQRDIDNTIKILRQVKLRYGMRVIAGHWAGRWALPGSPALNVDSPQAREAVRQSVKRMVELYGREDWLLYWDIGNENNYTIPAGMSLETYYRFMDELAAMVRKTERTLGVSHPILLGNGGLTAREARLIAMLTYFSGLGINAYPNMDFATEKLLGDASGAKDIFDLSPLPVVITEAGVWNDSPSDPRQSQYLRSWWAVLANTAWHAGFTVFSAQNEPWKVAETKRPGEGKFGILGTAFERQGGFRGFEGNYTPKPGAPEVSVPLRLNLPRTQPAKSSAADNQPDNLPVEEPPRQIANEWVTPLTEPIEMPVKSAPVETKPLIPGV